MVIKNRGSDFELLYADKKSGLKTKLKELHSCSQAKRKQYAEKE
ncbi:hypothetical protein GGR32_000453 [Mesonia hippocampi]|uniref:Uncharacterized protein n=1 Tax=Mesonia hippocampi TaxID=1628250 RepID=A0A840EM77_9FLAO|nr:hypothetical protein [Mesonia hippocampi]MBB4118181.1 hypothetical protein [Mesonia hippocampi]